MVNEPKIDLVKAFMQFECGADLSITIRNYDKKGGYMFSGLKDVDGGTSSINITLDKNQIEAINDCDTILEIYECYKEMEYF